MVVRLQPLRRRHSRIELQQQQRIDQPGRTGRFQLRQHPRFHARLVAANQQWCVQPLYGLGQRAAAVYGIRADRVCAQLRQMGEPGVGALGTLA